MFLTTHYMDEAQALADHVAVIAKGEIVATGTPAQLGGRGEAPSLIRFTPPPGAELPRGAELEAGRAVMRTSEPVRALHALTAWALENGHELRDLEVARPTLEDIYLQLTEGR